MADEPSASPGGAKTQADAPEQVRLERLYRVWPTRGQFPCLGFGVTGPPGTNASTSRGLRALRAAVFGRTCLATSGEGCISKIERSALLERPCCLVAPPAHCLTWACLVLPSVLYCVVAMPYYWSSFHPLLPIATMILFALALGFLVAASCTDPGIIPRREVIEALGIEEKVRQELGYDVMGNSVYDVEDDRTRIPKELRDSGHRWCTTCKIVRPPRASHCRCCDTCVVRFDHHCPFLNTCVGQRNYAFFVAFMASATCLALLVVPALLWYCIVGFGFDRGGCGQHSDAAVACGTPSAPTDTIRIAIVVIASCVGLGSLLVMLLWVYHIFLIATGLTTKEHWKGTGGAGDECKELTLLAPRKPRLFDPRSFVQVTTAGGQEGWRLQSLSGTATATADAAPPSSDCTAAVAGEDTENEVDLNDDLEAGKAHSQPCLSTIPTAATLAELVGSYSTATDDSDAALESQSKMSLDVKIHI